MDSGQALPRCENVGKTLRVLLRLYGLVVDESASSISALIANAMNGKLQTKFRMMLGSTGLVIPPCRLFLRRIAQCLPATVVVVSTRSKPFAIRPISNAERFGGPEPVVVLLEVADSFESIRTYTPLACSRTLPRPERQSLSAPADTMVPKAIFRENIRGRLTHTRMNYSYEDAKECLEDSW
jgi:hypothetical protein